MTRNGRPPSMADVAELVGVSHQTVSRVVNGKGRVSPRTRERVQAAIDQLGYRPNSVARALVTARSGIIGVVTTTSAHFGPSSMLVALEVAAREAGLFTSVVALDRFGADDVASAFDHFSSLAAEAIVVIAPVDSLAEAVASPGTDECPDMARTDIVLDGLGVRARGAWAPAPTSGVITPGIVTALCGPSGAGKSTIVACLLADMTPDAGRILLRPSASSSESGESVLSDINPAAWRRHISWVPQSPTLVPGTILDNMGDLPLDDLSDAAAATGFDEVLASAPDGWNTVIGSGGVGLSVGQRQRLALTRALAAHSQVVILDEPTAHLDAVSEETVVRAIDAMRDAGRTVIVIAHRAAMMEAADAVIDVRSAADEEARA